MQPKNADEERVRPNKSQLKREMQTLKDHAAYLCTLKHEQVNQLSLNKSLLAGLEEFKRIKNKNAQQRHIQFLTKLLVEAENIDDIKTKLESMQRPHIQQQKIEKSVDSSFVNMLSENETDQQSEIQLILSQNTAMDRQQFLQLIRNAKKELENPPTEEQDKNSNNKQQLKLKQFLRQHYRHILLPE